MPRTNVTLPLRVAVALVVLLSGARPGFTQVLTLQFQQGVVTLHAENISPRDILREWTTIGGTTVVNANRVSDSPLSIHLENVTEAAALATLLRDVSGYIAVRRTSGGGASILDRIVIGPGSPAPVSEVRTARALNTPVTAQAPDETTVSQDFPSVPTPPINAATPNPRSGAPVPGPSSGLSAGVSSSSFGATPRSGKPGEVQPLPSPPPGPTVVGSPSGHQPPAPVPPVPVN